MVYIILGEGFEEIEALAPGDILRRGGVEVAYAGIDSMEVTGGHQITVKADILLKDIELPQAEMLIIPGGLGGVESILASHAALEIINTAHQMGIELAAICAAPSVLGRLGIVQGRRAVCYPGFEDKVGGDMQSEMTVVRDKGLTTGRSAGASIDFGLELLEVLRGREAAEKVRQGICYDR